MHLLVSHEFELGLTLGEEQRAENKVLKSIFGLGPS